MYIYTHVYIYMPDPINYSCSLTGRQISEKSFACRSVQIFKVWFRGFNSPGSDPPHKIMRYWFNHLTRSAFSFSVIFVPGRFQLPGGISGGPAFDFFCMIHRGGWIYTYIHTYTYIYIHIYIYIHTYTHTYTYIHAHTYTHTYTHIHTHICIHTCTHIHTYMHTRIHKCVADMKHVYVWTLQQAATQCHTCNKLQHNVISCNTGYEKPQLTHQKETQGLRSPFGSGLIYLYMRVCMVDASVLAARVRACEWAVGHGWLCVRG